MNGPACILAAACLGGLISATPAAAGTLTTSNGALVYDAAPGEQNYLYFYAGDDPTKVEVSDDVPVTLGARANAVCAAHALEEDLWVCPRPTAFVARLGDQDDGFTVVDLDDVLDVPVHVDGGAGADNLGGGIANDALSGGPGDDILNGYRGHDALLGGDGNDALSGYEGDDVLDGGAGDDSLEDYLIGENLHAGADTYIGGPGADDLSYFLRFEPLVISLDDVANDGAAGEGDNVGGDIETVGGGHADDTIVGNDLPNSLWGSSGNDHIVGLGGNDRLDGDDGADTLEGGAGADRLEGGCADDVIVGGSGPDELLADHGCSDMLDRGTNDRMFARDGEADLVFCSGPGLLSDHAEVDAIDNATTAFGPGQCRSLDVALGGGGGGGGGGTPPPGGPGGGGGGGGDTAATPGGKVRVTLGPVKLYVGNGKAGQAPAQRIDLTAKRPRLTLGSVVTARPAKVRAVATMARKGRKRLTLGTSTMTVKAGTPRTLGLTLTKAARSAVKSRTSVTARVTLAVTEQGKKAVKKTYTAKASVKKAPKKKGAKKGK